jgi:hypothetical protein
MYLQNNLIVLDIGEFNRVKGLESAHGIWDKLKEIHEGSNTVKEAKLYIFKGKFSEFAMNKDEDVPTMFNRLNDIVNELKCLGFIVPDEEFSQKFLRSLPEKCGRTNLNYTGSSTRVPSRGLQRTSNGTIPCSVGLRPDKPPIQDQIRLPHTKVSLEIQSPSYFTSQRNYFTRVSKSSTKIHT